MDIEDLYDLIPDFICTAGCYECCENFGVPSRTRVEDERVKAFLRENSMQLGKAVGNTCPYLKAGCSISGQAADLPPVRHISELPLQNGGRTAQDAA